MIPAKFDYLAPTSVEEALAALGEHGDDAKILAGGQSLLPVLRMRLNAPEVLIDLGGLDVFYNISTYLFDDMDNGTGPSPLLRPSGACRMVLRINAR